MCDMASARRRYFRRPAVVILSIAVLAGAVLLLGGRGLPPRSVSFSQSTKDLDAYDFVEITAQVSAPHAPNPFTDAAIRGTFETVADGKRWQVEGFCDAEDGSVYRVRFMPSGSGRLSLLGRVSPGVVERDLDRDVSCERRPAAAAPSGSIPRNRWHFVWEGTGEHYFFNGTTAYWLMGWRDDRVIESSIERLHRLKINRIRVTIAGRTSVFYGEPVMAGRSWTPFITPWPTGDEACATSTFSDVPASATGLVWVAARSTPWPTLARPTTSIIRASTTAVSGVLLAEVRAGTSLCPRS